jgi:two-component system phosphate regulon sensor histidine kinase PhoR
VQGIIFILLALTAGGAIAGWYVTHKQALRQRRRHHELTEHLNEEITALKTRCASLEAAGEAAYNALILVNEERIVTYMNEAARQLFDVPSLSSAALSNSVMALTHNHELDQLAADALREEAEIGLQITIRDRPHRVRALRVETPGGVYAALALEDVSELQRLGRARRDMVANVSHELRTPITSIRLLVDTLLREDRPDRKARNLLKKIAAETDTLQQMAQELLDLAMIESGRAEIILLPVELRPIIEEAISRFAEQAERNEQIIEAQVPPGLKVLADATQLGRVLNNLLHNAIKFTPPRGQINISVGFKDEWVMVAVTDSGPGIPPEERERVFERFYRGDRARSRGSGTGLGLAIAKHIVAAHGGTIWAEDPPVVSGTPGEPLQGARVCFTLPAAER